MQQKNDEQMIYGIRPVMEALHAGKEIEKIFITRGARGDLMQELKQLMRDRKILYTEVPVEKLNRFTRKNHQDVVCFISSVTYQFIEDIIPAVFEKGETPLVLILDRITDVRNFGAIARTAECAGVHAIVIPAKGAAQINADAIKTSAGALNSIPVCRIGNLNRAIEFLKESGLQIIAATEKTSEVHYQADYTSPCAIIMGSEEDGISSDLLKLADKKIKIPLLGSIESLNVSVACGVVLFEALRQRGRVG
ncbi:MAG: 23S rRNA (guanosine(2251)-2'-O)-methyltransferase RlmB [Bacteroidetes bacterium]|nr:23S rRNA (guanosine(2251)-2'-O)-methyltransferase RlmB [Bacteroidota bacterium]